MTARGFAAFPKVKRRVATTWWGKAWVKALEDTALDTTLLRLGRRYAHAGVVGPITVSPGRLHASVHDDSAVHNTTVHVPVLTEVQWGRFLDRVAEQAGHIAALLDNDMPRSLVEAAEESGVDLLPGIGDLEPDCDCEGWELPCLHAAALAFQVGWLLDADPFVLLLLKGKPEQELLDAVQQRVAGPVGTRTPVVVSHEATGQLPAKPGLPTTTPVVLAVEPPPGFEAAELTALMEIAANRARALLRSGTLEW
ncbi:SWIM zinc finger family protein [Lentzea nigeriaca]|uniref:SWIM zinc finger family protein n=1 Tax=Lentzea nigeriaca TaxID=1128665 RepID=UPI001959A3CE|nr:SWIM zinc finger family protein [Lentzea nigeriaca]MBM7862493.1 putative Zn finger protein [Lentzea nigeriaca]